jgi:hypothetical protein
MGFRSCSEGIKEEKWKISLCENIEMSAFLFFLGLCTISRIEYFSYIADINRIVPCSKKIMCTEVDKEPKKTNSFSFKC